MRKLSTFLSIVVITCGLSLTQLTVKADDSGPDDAPNGFLSINSDNSTSFVNNPKFTKADQEEYEWGIQHYPHTPYVIPTSFTSNRKQEYKSPSTYRILKTYKIKPQWFHSSRGAYYSSDFTKINGITEDTPDVSWISTKKALVYSKATHTKRTFYYVSNNVKPNNYKLKDYFNYVYGAENYNKRNAGWIWSGRLKTGKYNLNQNANSTYLSNMIAKLFPGTIHEKNMDKFCKKNINHLYSDLLDGLVSDKYGNDSIHIDNDSLYYKGKSSVDLKNWNLLRSNRKSLTEYLRYGAKENYNETYNFNDYKGWKIGVYADPITSKNYGQVLIVLAK